MTSVAGVPGVDFSVEDVRGTFPEELEITPLERPPDASIRVPGSKSVTNRALLVAAQLGAMRATERLPALGDGRPRDLGGELRVGSGAVGASGQEPDQGESREVSRGALEPRPGHGNLLLAA